jgi:hypothetical protein
MALASGEVLALGGRNDDSLALTAIETGTPRRARGPSGLPSRFPGSGTPHRCCPSGQVLLPGGADGSGAWPMKAADLHG